MQGILVGSVYCAILFLSTVPALAEVVNRIVATIDGEPVTLYEFDKFVERTTGGQPGVDRAILLEMFITDKLIQKEVRDKGIVVRDEDIDRYIEGIKQQNRINDQQLRQALTAQGMTWETYRAQVREEIQKVQLINREIRGKVSVTPEEVDRYYQAHIEEYATPGHAHLRHIMLYLPAQAPDEEVRVVMAKADELARELQDGADFEELARRESQDPTAKDGGDLGWLRQGEMLEAIEKAAMPLEPGEISTPVRSEVGVHIIRLEERRAASHTPLDELAEDIKEKLYSAALEERYRKWLTEDLRERHFVEIRP